MKKIILFSLLVIALSQANSQTFHRVPVHYVKMDHITLNGGTAVNFSNPMFKLMDVVDYTSKGMTPGTAFAFNSYSSHNDISDNISHGIEFNFYYLKSQWDATFSSETMGDPNFYYRYYGKFSEAGFSFGPALTIKPSDRFDILASAGIGMGFLLYGDTKTEAVRLKNDEVYPDPSLNEWHEPNADENFSLEFGLYAKLGGYYRLTDVISLGLIGIYNIPLLGTATVDNGSISNAQNLGYGMTGYVGKLNLGSLMLSLRFDID